ncbi:hypothetical protein [Kordiimonas sp.]|uniref:hypothetical protein n=1 Tax=Kordiimonas sp. TaxID=1970157 RepID=UPI003A8CE0D8
MIVKNRWYGPAVQRSLDRQISQRVYAAGRTFVEQLKANIGRPSPEPSKPGEYPRLDTGDLYRSISGVMNRQGLTYIAGTDVEYSQNIEAIRPHLVRTLKEASPRMRRAFKNG